MIIEVNGAAGLISLDHSTAFDRVDWRLSCLQLDLGYAFAAGLASFMSLGVLVEVNEVKLKVFILT